MCQTKRSRLAIRESLADNYPQSSAQFTATQRPSLPQCLEPTCNTRKTKTRRTNTRKPLAKIRIASTPARSCSCPSKVHVCQGRQRAVAAGWADQGRATTAWPQHSTSMQRASARQDAFALGGVALARQAGLPMTRAATDQQWVSPLAREGRSMRPRTVQAREKHAPHTHQEQTTRSKPHIAPI